MEMFCCRLGFDFKLISFFNCVCSSYFHFLATVWQCKVAHVTSQQFLHSKSRAPASRCLSGQPQTDTLFIHMGEMQLDAKH